MPNVTGTSKPSLISQATSGSGLYRPPAIPTSGTQTASQSNFTNNFGAGLGNIPGMLPSASATTPLKSTSITHPTGTVITNTYHAPAVDATKKTTQPATSQDAYDKTTGLLTDYGKSKGLPEVNGQQTNTESQQPQQNNATNQGLLNDLANKGNSQSQAYTDAKNTYQTDVASLEKLREQEANSMAGEANRAIPLNFIQGRQQVLQGQYGQREAALGSQISADSNLLSAANTQTGQQIGATQSALGYTQPTSVDYGVRYGSPQDLAHGTEQGAGQYGTGVGASSNIQSVRDAQTGINNMIQYAPQVTQNLTRARDLGKLANLEQNSPLITALQHAVSSGLITNQGLVAFNSVIQSLNDILPKLGEAPIDVTSITPQALNQLIQTLPNNLSVKKSGYQNILNTYGGGSSNGSSGSYTSSSGNTYNLPY